MRTPVVFAVWQASPPISRDRVVGRIWGRGPEGSSQSLHYKGSLVFLVIARVSRSTRKPRGILLDGYFRSLSDHECRLSDV